VPPPDQGFLSELRFSGGSVDHTQFSEPTLDQPRPEDVEIVHDQPAVDAGHFSLGSTIDDRRGQPFPKGAPRQTSIPSADSQQRRR